MPKYKPTVYRSSQACEGFRCELSVRQETLESLGMSMDEFFEAAAPFVKLQAEKFYKENFMIGWEDA